MSARTAIATLAGALTLFGCGGGSGGASPPETRRAAPERTILGRRDVPPAGVAAQISWFDIGDGYCLEYADYEGSPAIRFSPGRSVEIGERFFSVCLLRFARSRPITVLIRRSDGRSFVRRPAPGVSGNRPAPGVSGGGIRHAAWQPLPGDPLGRYTATASAGATQAQGSFEVRRAAVPRIAVADRGSSLPAGARVPVALAGFRPGERVRVDIYEERPSHGDKVLASYRTSIIVHADARGEALRAIPSKAADRGRYALVARGARAYVTLEGRR